MWYIHTMEYYATIKRNEILPFAMMWMEPEGIMLSEISQSERDSLFLKLFFRLRNTAESWTTGVPTV